MVLYNWLYISFGGQLKTTTNWVTSKTKFILSELWKIEAWNQSVGRADSLEAPRRSVSYVWLSGFLHLQAILRGVVCFWPFSSLCFLITVSLFSCVCILGLQMIFLVQTWSFHTCSSVIFLQPLTFAGIQFPNMIVLWSSQFSGFV